MARDSILSGDKKILYNAGYEAIQEYRNRSNIKKKSPKVKLVVAPFATPFIPLELVSQDLGGIIQSCTWAKSRSNAGGAVQVTLAGDNRAIQGLGIMLSKPLEALWKSVGPDLRDLFKPMTLCQLWRDGYHVMTGYVRSCRRKSQVGSITYSVEIDELGSLYSQNLASLNTIWYGEYQNLFNDVSRFLTAGSTQIGTPLWMTLNSFASAFHASTMTYGNCFPSYMRLSDGLPLAFRMVALPPPLGAISTTSLVSQLVTDTTMFQLSGGSSFWDYIKSLCPEPFMELFTESGGRTICVGRSVPTSTGAASIGSVMSGISPVIVPGLSLAAMLPGFNYIVARTSPYDIPWTGITPWVNLYMFTMGILDLILAGDFVIITDDDVISKDLGQNDSGQYTVFHVEYGGKNATGGGGAGGIRNRPSVARGPAVPLFSGGVRSYGARELHANIAATSMKWGGALYETIERMSNYAGMPLNIPALSTLLNVWFRNGGKFNEGSITTRAIPYARPGMCLLYMPSVSGSRVDNNRDIGLYYIDNLTDNYQIGQADTTTFSLIRGVPLPMSASAMARLLMDWEIFPPGFNLVDEVLSAMPNIVPIV
jgi:hypothetical protein